MLLLFLVLVRPKKSGKPMFSLFAAASLRCRGASVDMNHSNLVSSVDQVTGLLKLAAAPLR